MEQLIERVKAILLTPQTEWPIIAQGPGETRMVLARHVAVLALIPAIARFVGGSLIGGFTPVDLGLGDAIAGYILAFVSVVIVAISIRALAPTFGADKTTKNALKLTVYSYTPAWLAGIFLLIPGLNFLLILGVYGLYLLWVGLPVLMQVRDDRAFPYASVVTACALIPAVVLAIV